MYTYEEREKFSRVKITPTGMPTENYYTYELRYPNGCLGPSGEDVTGVVFYIGKGTIQERPPQRIDQHEANARKEWNRINVQISAYNIRLRNAIWNIWHQKMSVQKFIIKSSDNKKEIKDFEYIRIVEISKTNKYLTNYAGHANLPREVMANTKEWKARKERERLEEEERQRIAKIASDAYSAKLSTTPYYLIEW